MFTSCFRLRVIPEGIQVATKLWINRIYSSAGRYQATSTTNYSSESCPPSTTLHVLHLTQLQQSQALSSWIEKLKANYVLTFVVLSCFQFPTFTLLLAILIPEPSKIQYQSAFVSQVNRYSCSVLFLTVGEFSQPVQIE
ncbi:hypothetical protein XENOCAPTIV_020947 [Xenoophorus captivus]|uniref:Uncharacterized protein n=1 Tax=Xenoophorus captivus TaxID=1517983 RepID=A0ABV0RT70_9TELE